MKNAPDFKNHEEHDKWVIENAEYFTVISHSFKSRMRFETLDLETAKITAKELIKDTGRIALIYAVCTPYSAYVETMRDDNRNKIDNEAK